nr:Uma2 family endonuclease [Rhodospirillales bacterium]
MTVEEFLAWDPGDGNSRRWILRDGVPEMMGTPSQQHAAIQSELAYLLTAHLRERGSPCRVLTAGGVIPAFRREENMLSPDLAVTCDPAYRQHAIPNPVMLIEILSPSNARETHANLAAFATIPSVAEIVVI